MVCTIAWCTNATLAPSSPLSAATDHTDGAPQAAARLSRPCPLPGSSQLDPPGAPGPLTHLGRTRPNTNAEICSEHSEFFILPPARPAGNFFRGMLPDPSSVLVASPQHSSLSDVTLEGRASSSDSAGNSTGANFRDSRQQAYGGIYMISTAAVAACLPPAQMLKTCRPRCGLVFSLLQSTS